MLGFASSEPTDKMIAANQFVINHMNPTNLKMTDLFVQPQVLFERKGVANYYRLIGCGLRCRAFRLAWILNYAVVTICVLGSLGCQPSEVGKSTSQSTRQGRIVGGSMAPHFLGDHFEVQCNGCSSEIVADEEQAKSSNSLVCPYCGFQNPVKDCRQQSSDRVTIDLGSSSISRWDVVAFQVPDSQEAGVKRVVGLPGESVEIRGGNLWLDGEMIRKTIDQQKCTRILIHDSKKTDSEKALWQAVDSQGVRLDEPGHRFEAGKFVWDLESDGSGMKWFEFCNQPNYARKTESDMSVGQEIRAWSIEDNYGYNQSLWRNLNVVDEIFVSLKISTTGVQRFAWKYKLGKREYLFEINVAGRELVASVLDDSARTLIGRYKLVDGMLDRSQAEVEFSTVDKRAIVLVDGIQLTQFELETPANGLPDSNTVAASLFQIGAAVKSGTSAEDWLDHVRIWRDIYYLPSQKKNGQFQILVGGPGGFLLLGDNQPVSIDSRHWPKACVPREKLIGKVLKKRRW